jgi:hypothetical protein
LQAFSDPGTARNAPPGKISPVKLPKVTAEAGCAFSFFYTLKKSGVPEIPD